MIVISGFIKVAPLSNTSTMWECNKKSSLGRGLSFNYVGALTLDFSLQSCEEFLLFLSYSVGGTLQYQDGLIQVYIIDPMLIHQYVQWIIPAFSPYLFLNSHSNTEISDSGQQQFYQIEGTGHLLTVPFAFSIINVVSTYFQSFLGPHFYPLSFNQVVYPFVPQVNYFVRILYFILDLRFLNNFYFPTVMFTHAVKLYGFLTNTLCHIATIIMLNRIMSPLKNGLCFTLSTSPPPHAPGKHWSFYHCYSFAFSRMSFNYN